MEYFEPHFLEASRPSPQFPILLIFNPLPSPTLVDLSQHVKRNMGGRHLVVTKVTVHVVEVHFIIDMNSVPSHVSMFRSSTA